MIRKHFRLKRLVVGLAFAAIAAPVAQATPYINGPTSPTQAAEVRQSYLTTEVSPYEVRGTHVLSPGMTITKSSVVRSENSFGAPGPSAAGATGPELIVGTASSTSFDWADASVGAGIALGMALVLLTAVGLNRRSRSRLVGA